jgi:hypothetical protein
MRAAITVLFWVLLILGVLGVPNLVRAGVRAMVEDGTCLCCDSRPGAPPFPPSGRVAGRMDDDETPPHPAGALRRVR